jgi:hypothetical protein
MPKPIDRVSRHAWIVTHHVDSKRFRRFEMGGDSELDPFADFAAGDVMLHGVVEMSDAEHRSVWYSGPRSTRAFAPTAETSPRPAAGYLSGKGTST